jgi:type I restriction enzyme S subunit
MIRHVPIAEVAEVNPSPPKWLRNQPGARVAFVPMSAVSEGGTIDVTETRDAGEVLKGYTYFERGDILVAKITPCLENGKAALVPDSAPQVGFGSTEFHVLRPGPEIDRRYLFYAIWNTHFRCRAVPAMTGSAGQKRLPAEALRRYRLALPPLEEQRRIAAILDKADAIRRKRQQAIQLTDDLLRSAFLDMFGDPIINPRSWAQARLDSVADIRSGITKGRRLNPAQVVLVPYMRVANVQDGHIALDEVKEIEVLRDEVDTFRLLPGDILLTEGGDPDKLGRGAVWHGQIDPCVHQNHIFRVRPNVTVVLPDFLGTLIGSTRGKGYFGRAAKQTTGIATINRTQLGGFPVLLPPVDLQQRYAKLVKQTGALEGRVQERYSEGDALFESLCRRAFRGEL